MSIRLLRLAGSLLVLVCCLTVSYAHADCTVRARVVAKAVVVPAVLAPVAVAVTVPSYSASYLPQAGADQNTEILKALRALNDRLDRLEKGATPAAPQAKALEVKPGAAPPVFAAKCAGCHQEGQQAKGGGFVLLARDGALAAPEPRQWGLAATRTYLGEMPPKGGQPCTDEEVGQIQEFVRQQLRK